MTPITRISISKLHQAARGTLAINRIGHDRAPRLIAENIDEDGDADKFYVPLAIVGGGAFVCQPVVVNEGLWMPADRWELRVDRESAYSAVNAMPLPGDAIISDAVAGIIAIYNGAQAYVSLTGDLIPEPNWADSFVGFRKWEIVHWPADIAVSEVLAERDPPP